MAYVLNVELRETRGKRNARRQRIAGQLPAVLYGHGQASVSLSLPSEMLESAIRHGARLVNLTGAVEEQAFVREVQWNTWGTHIVHVDFTRVSEHEKVQVRVIVELRGVAPGLKAGGVLKHLVHEVEIECEATAIPEKISISINQLMLGDSITIASMTLPAGVVVLGDPETIVVECVEPVEETDEEASGPVEPEVIGRKKEEEEEGE